MTHDICLRSEPLALRSLKVKVSGPCRGATRTPNLHAPPSIDQVRRTTAPYQMLTKPLKLYSAPCRIHRCAPGRAAPVSKAAEYCTVQLDQAVGGTLEVGWKVLVHSESRKYLVRSYKVPVPWYNPVQTLTLVLGILFAPLRVTHTTGNVVTHGWS